eukprot:TRINITY_DN12609_c0_g1_i1.p2 TRINITY_DN12609_c0_g1~~TRINITY_DN12609_c0_g1_i1.p2  ORF type:complete len:244 (-),score=97.73 TRINITY_DN12609_c0_g1_i1:112-843(-)
MSKKKTYYEILEVDKTASDDEIRRSYRRLALKWHPDKNQERKEEAERHFKEISEAYSALSSKRKRRQYDLGEEDDFGFSFKDARKLFADLFGSFDLFADDFFPEGFFGKKRKKFEDEFFGEDFFEDFDKKGTTMYSTSIRSSTVIKDGVKTTKTKKTEIGPDGTEKVKITEEVVGKDGKVTKKQKYLEDGKEKDIKAITMREEKKRGKRKKAEGNRAPKKKRENPKKPKKSERPKRKKLKSSK